MAISPPLPPSHSPYEHSERWERWRHRLRFRHPGRLPRRLVVLLLVVALSLAGWGGWLIHEERQDLRASRQQIEEGCDGLVSPDKVLDLSGGPRVTVEDSLWEGGDARENGVPRWSCRTSGQSFRLLVVPQPDPAERVVVRTRYNGPFAPADEGDEWADLTREVGDPLPQPLGDGSLGSYTDDTVEMWIRCEGSTQESVRGIRVTAMRVYGSLRDHERLTLASVATEAAEGAAQRLGCPVTLPELPAELPLPTPRLSAADRASGTCSWYSRFVGAGGRGRLPDRALGTPEASSSWREDCVLGVSRAETLALWPTKRALDEDDTSPYGDIERTLTTNPWWVGTSTYFNGEVQRVTIEEFGRQVAVQPGTAGREGDVWWASSVCAGEPAVHVLRAEYGYTPLVRDSLPALFRAYVTDVAERRGCTDLALPRESDFRE